jgi:hypothetical protein
VSSVAAAWRRGGVCARAVLPAESPRAGAHSLLLLLLLLLLLA